MAVVRGVLVECCGVRLLQACDGAPPDRASAAASRQASDIRRAAVEDMTCSED